MKIEQTDDQTVIEGKFFDLTMRRFDNADWEQASREYLHIAIQLITVVMTAPKD